MDYGFINKLKNVLIGIIVIILLISSSSLTSFAGDQPKSFTFSGGEGTKSNPYLISNINDLIELSDAMLSGSNARDSYFKLTTDIDLEETEWKPIGNRTIGFNGVFDGNGKKITIKKFASGNIFGLFGIADSSSTIKNLIVRGIIDIKVDTDEEVYFGLVAGKSEGTIENCITEGSVTLIVNTPKDFYFGGVMGFGRGSFSYIQNDASLSLTRAGQGYTALGGIVGSSRGNIALLSNITNTGTIDANIDGRILAGGITGEYGFGPNIYNALNQGNISIVDRKIDDKIRVATGGITGEIRESNIDMALNKGKVYMSYAGNLNKGEIITGGITGIAENSKLLNVGNEGAVESNGSKVLYAAGIIGNVGRQVTVANAYNKGKIYGTSPDKNAELYIAGLVEGIAIVDNFYNTGSVKLKAGNMREIDGDIFSNIRPGENTKTFNHSYWVDGTSPFPPLQETQPTTSPFNPGNGKLSSNVNIGGKSYGSIVEALNAWISTQHSEYLKWSGENTPTFEVIFGYSVPDYMKYKNQREGKWLNTSDWAYQWMDKADKLDIIPDVLINANMTKGITRREFSALAVELYEKISGKVAIANINSPFSDSKDQAVIKAYALGIVSGIGNGLFAPNALLSREEASVMLTRAYKAAYWEGWTLEKDKTYSNHSLDIEGVAKFSDDNLISSWARDSVYFMAKNGIINGIGNNLFAPSHKAGERENYGRATREEAFKIVVAMIEKFR